MGTFVADAVHVYPDLTVHLVAYAVTSDAQPHPGEHTELRWLTAAELDTVPWAPADRPLLDAVRDLLARSD